MGVPLGVAQIAKLGTSGSRVRFMIKRDVTLLSENIE